MRREEETLKTLNSETRRKIIKELSSGYRTPSDLSRILRKSKSTIVEHLEKLMNAGLVEKKQRPGRKWVFYSLTDRGERLVSPKTNKIIIILSITLLSILAGSFSLFNYLRQPILLAEPLAEKAVGEGREILIGARNPIFLYVSIGLFAVSMIGIISLMLMKRKRMEV